MAKETAKLAVTVDLPTPPFPDATAIMLLMPGMAFPFMDWEAFAAGASTLVFIFTTVAAGN